ncbi:MAG: pyridoxamine 5'-phosphate oxidase [Actinomycetota bacterium]|nr:pyridoxamine 5'-phosphate oxidase [Actinomycetota bacterium]
MGRTDRDGAETDPASEGHRSPVTATSRCLNAGRPTVSSEFTLAGEESGDDPLTLFGRWLEDARAAAPVGAETMVLATATPDGRPSARAVLLRGVDERGLVAYTDTRSRKGAELAANAWGALVFVWPPLERQVRVEGPVVRVSDDEADDYFATRPRGHRLAAWASHQTQPLASRDDLEARVAEITERHRRDDVARPPWWGGYRVVPAEWEFWAGRENRVHDRVAYVGATDTGWERRRLSP